MKTKNLPVVILLSLVAGTSSAQTTHTLWATNVTDNVPTFTTSDSFLTLSTLTPSTSTNRYLSVSGDFFGIQGGTMDERLMLAFAPDTGLSSVTLKWTRADISISGFASDPLVSGSAGTITSASRSGRARRASAARPGRRRSHSRSFTTAITSSAK